MKKFIALLAVVLMLPCIALADPAAILASDPEEVMTFDRDSQVTASGFSPLLSSAKITLRKTT